MGLFDIGKAIGIKWNPAKPLKVSVTTPKMTLLDAAGLASMGAGGWQNLMKGGLKSFSTKNLANGLGLDHLVKTVGSGDLSKLGLQDLMSIMPGEGGIPGIEGLDPNLQMILNTVGGLTGSKNQATAGQTAANYTAGASQGGDVVSMLMNGLLSAIAPTALQGVNNLAELAPTRRKLIDRTLANNSLGADEASVMRLLNMLTGQGQDAAHATGAELTAQGYSPAVSSALMHDANNEATKQANTYRGQLSDPTHQQQVIMGLLNLLDPNSVAPELGLATSLATGKENMDQERQRIKDSRAANRPPSTLESALPALAGLAGEVDWAKVFSKPKKKGTNGTGNLGTSDSDGNQSDGGWNPLQGIDTVLR